MTVEALFYQKASEPGKPLLCELCPHFCKIAPGRRGICGVRANEDGTLTAESYGKISSIALDPIEKKPLYRFKPGSAILSVGSYGCNFRCAFCQNHEISMAKPETVDITPCDLADKAAELVPSGNIGIAYTYNEPFMSYEFMLDCAREIRSRKLANVIVTNGFVNPEPLREILPLIDAMNIDLKSFEPDFYKNIGGRLDPVRETIAASHAAGCHVELTTLAIPGENDSDAEMEALSSWVAGISPEIPLHISRFFPRYKMHDKKPTPRETVYRLADIAKRRLKYVFVGNV